MNVRSIALSSTFLAAAATAIFLVAGAATPNDELSIADSFLDEDEEPAVGQNLEYAHVRDFLASVPDPKNLFASGKPSALPFASCIGVRHFRRERAVPGVIEVVRGHETVGLFQACVEMIPIDATRFVLHRAWHDAEVVVICVDVAKLQPLFLQDPIAEAEAVRDGESFFLIDPAACTEMRIPRDLEAGRHAIEVPEGARGVRELFAFFPSTHAESANQIRLMQIEPGRGRVTVVAPLRKAFAEFDDAQTAARLLRDPTTARVVGDGLHIRPFVLSADLCRVERWLD